ncbi:MAG: hypothetical protein JOZ03_09675 [Gammaproteobacteria bacterium]|nr:hypothetical protein [Gammaproteobacteria bacterium]
MPTRVGAARGAALAALLLAGACAHLHAPWRHPPPPAPAAVHELDVGGTDAAAVTQRWKRNTLLLDLSALPGSGSLTLRPVAGTTWPARLALRVRPGAFAELEVRGAQRLALPISTGGTAPIDLELPPGIYTAATPELAVSWGAGSAPAP